MSEVFNQEEKYLTASQCSKKPDGSNSSGGEDSFDSLGLCDVVCNYHIDYAPHKVGHKEISCCFFQLLENGWLFGCTFLDCQTISRNEKEKRHMKGIAKSVDIFDVGQRIQTYHMAENNHQNADAFCKVDVFFSLYKNSLLRVNFDK